jgi:hypothetical protein
MALAIATRELYRPVSIPAPFPKREPAQPPPEPVIHGDFEWRPKPGDLVQCNQNGESTRIKNVLVEKVYAKSAAVRFPGHKNIVEIPLSRIHRWLAGEQRAKEQMEARTKSNEPIAPVIEEARAGRGVMRVDGETLLVVNKISGLCLTNSKMNPGTVGYTWTDDPDRAYAYMSRDSLHNSVSKARQQLGDFEYLILPLAEAKRIRAEQLKLVPLMPEPEELKLEPELAPITAPPTASIPIPVEVAQAVAAHVAHHSAPAMERRMDPGVIAAQKHLGACLDDEAAAREMYAQARARTRSARQKLKFIESSCACAVKP